MATFSGNESKDVRTASREPNLEDLKRRTISCKKNLFFVFLHFVNDMDKLTNRDNLFFFLPGELLPP